VKEGTILSREVHLIDSGNRAGFFVQELECDMFVEVLDVLVPLVSIHELGHRLALLGVKSRVTSEAEVQPAFAHHVAQGFGPHHVELLLAIEDVLSRCVGRQIDASRNERRRIVGVIIESTQRFHDVGVLTGDCHWVLQRRQSPQKSHGDQHGHEHRCCWA